MAAGKVKPRSAVTLVWSAVVLTVLGLIGGLILAYRTLHRVLGGEPADAAHAGQQVAQGKLDMHLGHAPANSLHAHLQHIQTRLRKLLGAVWNEATAVDHSAKVLSGVVGSMQEVEYAAGEVLGRARDLSQQLDEQHRTSEELARHVESLSDTAARAKEGVSALDGTSQALSDQAATPSQAVARSSPEPAPRPTAKGSSQAARLYSLSFVPVPDSGRCPMNVFYEESGDFKVATVMSESGASLQVEDARGKRSKIKAADVRVRFDKQPLSDFLAAAQALAETLDLDFLWEVAGSEEFGFQDLATEYFTHPTPVESAAMAVRLHAAPMYFYRKGKGRYKAAPEENLRAAKAGAEKKAREAALIQEWSTALQAGKLPEAIRAQLKMLLHKPDKNTIEWKAVAQAADATQQSVLRLLAGCGAIPDVEAWLLDSFLAEYFPKGPGFPEIAIPTPPTGLPAAGVRAFSIDDAATTEIDDAFSVTPLDNGHWRIGIHIAAPTLGLAPGSAIEQLVLARLSTVYFPGNKITMLPDAVVDTFTLAEGRDVPAVSMYVEVTPELEIVGHESRVDCVHIAANLRHHDLDPVFNDTTVAQPDAAPDFPWRDELILLYRLAIALEKRRGKHDPNRVERPDYSFAIETNAAGQKRVTITPRKRGSPMDKLVAELMIFVNSEWGKLLADRKVAAIYRAQQMGRVRMTTQPAPHMGLGVAQYSWASSPLRRAADFINQQQLVALLTETPPRYAMRDPMLFAAMRDFDQTYNAYADFQARMERYWCLRWLEQEGVREIGATVLKENVVRFDGLPLILKIAGLPELPRGTPVRLQLIATDYLDLGLECRLLSTGEPVVMADEEEEVAEAAEVPDEADATVASAAPGMP